MSTLQVMQYRWDYDEKKLKDTNNNTQPIPISPSFARKQNEAPTPQNTPADKHYMSSTPQFHLGLPNMSEHDVKTTK